MKSNGISQTIRQELSALKNEKFRDFVDSYIARYLKVTTLVSLTVLSYGITLYTRVTKI